MKASALLKLSVLASVLALTASASADYKVVFDTDATNAGNPDNSVKDAIGVPLDFTYFGQIYAGPDASSLAPIGVPLHFGANNGTTQNSAFNGVITAGVVTGNNVPVAANSTVPGTYEIFAWTASAGGDYATASGVVGAQIGHSAPQPITLVDASASSIQIPNPVNTFPSFQLVIVPEPSVLALGLLGGAVLLFRRRK